MLRLVRRAYLPMGTFGQLQVPLGGFSCWTVERPWKNNQENISCIPVGTYVLKLGTFHRGTADPSDDYPAYEVLDVPDRSLIKIHIANVMDDVKGCIGLGRGLGWLKTARASEPKLAVTDSRTTYAEFMAAMGGLGQAHLVIENFRGGEP